jgi:hypothetical protein
MTRASWRRAEGVLACAAVCSLLAFLCLEFWFFKTSPKSSDSALGAIYPINWHGTIVYVTPVQQLETDALFWGSVALFLTALAIELRVKLRRADN